jgi:hypothetical protein
MSLEAALSDEHAFFNLVDSRAAQIAEYLQEAADREAGGTKSSLRFENRPDHRNCRKVLPRFREPWWGVVVYSCFDSVSGTEVVAGAFPEPLSTSAAERALRGLDPRIQSHRSMVGRARSKRSLISACAKAGGLGPVFTTPGLSFDERFDLLARIHVYAWNRTTNFDALARGGVLQTDNVGFRPNRAHLAGSSGPATGFARVWGISVTPSNADQCEALLRKWTSTWDIVAHRVGVAWIGKPYDSADLENALCVLKKRR